MRSARLWAAVWLLCTPAVLKAVPHSMSYQAMLKTSAGIPVANGFHVVTFSLYRSGTGGSALWTEIQTVATQAGLFSATLGATVPIPDSAFADTAAYLQLAVASDPPLSPRTRLVSTPFSMVSSAVRGEGPVDLKYEDLLNDELVTYSVDVGPPPGGSQSKGTRKDITINIREHQSSKRETMGPDSGYACLLHVAEGDDSIEIAESVDLAEDVARKDIRIEIRGQSGSKRESMGPDSGYVTHLELAEGDDSLQLTEIAHVGGGGMIQSGQAVAIPAFMKNARKAKTAEAAETRETLDIDSGYSHSVVLTSPSEQASKQFTVLSNTPNSGVSVPKFRTITSQAKSGHTAEENEFLDVDSGYFRSVAMGPTSGSPETEHTLSIAPPTLAAIAVPNLIEARKGSNSAASAESRLILDPDSGYSEVVSIETADLTTTHSHGSGHTREHVLLARQVGVPTGGTRTNQFATEVTDDSTHTRWSSEETIPGTPNLRTSEVHVSATDTEQLIELTSTTSGLLKWRNGVLLGNTEKTILQVSHQLAGVSNVLYGVADSMGARLGINTDNPSTEFHLVGSGCYTGTFGACSDRRFKDHITTLRDPLTTLQKLRGVNYTWKQEEFPEHQFPSGQQVGLIAQEVEKVVPGVVTTGEDGYKSVDYAKLVPLLIEAVKAQQRQIDELKEQLEGTGRLTSAGN